MKPSGGFSEGFWKIQNWQFFDLILFQKPRPEGSLILNVPKHAELVVIKRDIQRTALPPPIYTAKHASRTDKLE
jgi:hypothetical protein